VYDPEIYYKEASDQIKDADDSHKSGWFLVVPASADQGGESGGGITVYNNPAETGDILFYQNITDTNVYSPCQPMPLPYTNGLYLSLLDAYATIYVWPGETAMPM